MRPVLVSLFASLLLMHAATAQTQDDPYLWLEEVQGDKSLGWVRERNARAEAEFKADPRYEPLRRSLLSVLDSSDRIPYVTRMGDHYYNFWRDGSNPRGIWRRIPLDEYRSRYPRWEELLNLDALAAHENENWVWKGVECLRPESPKQPYKHCVIALSRGGADATVLREFDLTSQRLVLGQDAFVLGEGKQQIAWKDANTVWVMSEFGPGTATTSGYPRQVREWKRGSFASAAPVVFEGQPTDVSVSAFSERESGARRDWWQRDLAFWNSEYHVLVNGKPMRLDIPADAEPMPFADWLLVRTRAPWTVGGREYPGGALLAIKFDAFLQGKRQFDVLYEPGPRTSLGEVQTTRGAVLLTELDNVRGRLWELRPGAAGWQRTAVPVPDNAQIDILDTTWVDEAYLYSVQDFVTPTSLYSRTAGSTVPAAALKTMPRFFNADELETRQFEAVSKDGTKIPYFVVMKKGTVLNGRNPTLLYGYGGFAHPQLPWYSGVFGKGWLEPGGVLAVANLRGGGEFGPEWHRAAQKENKQRTWDDLAAVAEDLAKRGVTSPAQLGIMGGSQGGLLVTTAMTQRPELFGAVVAQVPLADMLRYHKLLAGASWIAEYGDPDKPEERAYIAKYSPYQNLRKDAKYPRLFLVTSTRDDRVHPAHARKMAARMGEQGHDVLYFENIEGGHGAAADNTQAARMWAQAFSFLWRQLGTEKR
jgi:prolyl oligopeptidase